MTSAFEFLSLPAASASLDAAWFTLLAATAIKGTIVLVAAYGVSTALGRASAAARHLVWAAALGAVLVLPLLSLALPAWRVALPATAGGRGVTVRASETAFLPATPQEQPSGGATAAAEENARIAWPAWVLLVWGAGLVFVLGRLALGTARLRGIAQRAVKLDAVQRDLISRLSKQLGLHRPVAVLESGRIATPMACGVVRPVILLPAAAAAWPLERLRVVLAHELAHVKRHDCLTQVLGQLACAAYWFNPLMWLAARNLRQERERASDDRVLSLGTQASDYAGHLVELARVLRPAEASWSMSVPMASPSHLEARVVAVLNPTVNRRTPSRQAAALAFLVMAALLIPVAALRAEKETGKIHGTVYDPSGAVVPDAMVTATNLDTKVKQSAPTSDDGRYQFPAIPAGRYELEIAAKGFAIARRQGLIQPGGTLQFDVTVVLGEVAQVTDVFGKAPRAASFQGKKYQLGPRVPHRIRVGGNVTMPKMVSGPKPVYPPEALEKGIEGTVMINAVIGMDGRVLDRKVINEPDPDLAKAAVEAVDQWRYQPTLLNGERIEVVTTISVNFRLEE